MATEEEKETKTKKSAKETVEIKSDPDLKSRIIASASSVKDECKGSK